MYTQEISTISNLIVYNMVMQRQSNIVIWCLWKIKFFKDKLQSEEVTLIRNY